MSEAFNDYQAEQATDAMLINTFALAAGIVGALWTGGGSLGVAVAVTARSGRRSSR